MKILIATIGFSLAAAACGSTVSDPLNVLSEQSTNDTGAENGSDSLSTDASMQQVIFQPDSSHDALSLEDITMTSFAVDAEKEGETFLEEDPTSFETDPIPNSSFFTPEIP